MYLKFLGLIFRVSMFVHFLNFCTLSIYNNLGLDFSCENCLLSVWLDKHAYIWRENINENINKENMNDRWENVWELMDRLKKQKVLKFGDGTRKMFLPELVEIYSDFSLTCCWWSPDGNKFWVGNSGSEWIVCYFNNEEQCWTWHRLIN